jgi:hypothetical protein
VADPEVHCHVGYGVAMSIGCEKSIVGLVECPYAKEGAGWHAALLGESIAEETLRDVGSPAQFPDGGDT